MNARNKIKFTLWHSLSTLILLILQQGNCALKGLQSGIHIRCLHSFIDNRVAKVNIYLQFVNLDLHCLDSSFLMPSSTSILNFQRLSLGEILLSGGGGRSGPDWVALIKNEVAVILDDKDNVVLGGGVRVPDSFIIVGAAHNFVSHKGLLYKVKHRMQEKIG